VDQGKFTVYTNTIKFIYQKHSGEWTAPQTYTSFPFYLETTNPASKLAWGNDRLQKLLKPNQLHWKKMALKAVMHQGNELLMVSTGPMASYDSYFHDNQNITIPANDQGNQHLKAFVQFLHTVLVQRQLCPINNVYKEIAQSVLLKSGLAGETNLDGQYFGVESFELASDKSSDRFTISLDLNQRGIGKKLVFKNWKDPLKDGVLVKPFTYQERDYVIIGSRTKSSYALFECDYDGGKLKQLEQIEAQNIKINDIQINYWKAKQSIQLVLTGDGDTTTTHELTKSGTSPFVINTQATLRANPDYSAPANLFCYEFRAINHQLVLPSHFLNHDHEAIQYFTTSQNNHIFFGRTNTGSDQAATMPICVKREDNKWMISLDDQNASYLANYAGLLNQTLKNNLGRFDFFKTSFTPKSNFNFFAIRNLDNAFYFTNGDGHYLFKPSLKNINHHMLNLDSLATKAYIVHFQDYGSTQVFHKKEPAEQLIQSLGLGADHLEEISTALILGVSSYKKEAFDAHTSAQGVTRIRSKAAHNIAHHISGFGIDGVLSRKVQGENSTNGHSLFSTLAAIPGKVNGLKVDNDGQVEFTGPCGIYSRELFFHAPILVAHLFAKNLQFDQAQKWLQYVFQPLASSPNGQAHKAVWNYLPFYHNDAAPVEHRTDTFDPDLIAEADHGIYMRWTVRQYIKNLMDWGDHEFRQETWASLSTANQLYFEVEDLLGQLPKSKDEVSALKAATFATIGENIDQSFKVPTNNQLKSLWTTVKDRLYKLRHGLNINGERQMPSAFAPTRNPAGMLATAHSGNMNFDQNPGLEGDTPNYRFKDLFPHAQSMVETVIQFGSQLYSALQQKDNHQLQVLYATHQQHFQDSISQSFKYQIEAAKKELKALKHSKQSIQSEKTHLEKLVLENISSGEKINLKLGLDTIALQSASALILDAASGLHLLPNIFGFSDGGMQFGSSVEAISQSLNQDAFAVQSAGALVSTRAAFARRMEGWLQQNNQLAIQLQQIQTNIDAAKIRVALAKENLSQHQLSISQAKEVLRYLTSKFTNADLYNWMVGQMTSLYFSAYQLALSNLHKLARAYEFEVGTKGENFIPSNSWNRLHKGLLAGETLKLGLAKLHDSYLTNNTRGMEIEKIFSLKALKS
ncbi:MAG: hypothetical protein AAGD05_06785, partial [Bacteroidota bacterium]